MGSPVGLADLFLWEPASMFNFTCGGGTRECDVLRDLGPPPDMILSIPPPPVPPTLEEVVSRLAAEAAGVHEGGSSAQEFVFGSAAPDEGTCNLCHWARTSNIGFVELAQKGPIIDDTLFLVIISSCVAAALIAIVLAIACFKYRDMKLKPLGDVMLAKKEKALHLEHCEAVRYPSNVSPVQQSNESQYPSKALWAAVKNVDDRFYTVDHCEPMSQKQARIDMIQCMEDKYDYKHYLPINCLTLAPVYSSGAVPIGQSKNSKQGTFENVGFVPGDDGKEKNNCLAFNAGISRATLLFSRNGSGRSTMSCNAPNLQDQQPLSLGEEQLQPHHHYEMILPQESPTPIMRRHMSLDRSSNYLGRIQNGTLNLRTPPTISAPISASSVRLPPLNGKPGRYALTTMANGRHTLTRATAASDEHGQARRSQVALDHTGSAMTSLAPCSPTDHVYASPLTSPVI